VEVEPLTPEDVVAESPSEVVVVVLGFVVPTEGSLLEVPLDLEAKSPVVGHPLGLSTLLVGPTPLAL
jgi:hypothetical protein